MTHSLAAVPTTLIGRDHVPGLLAGLVDTGSYQPSRPPGGSGVTAGQARIRNRPVMIYATDPAVRGGALSRAGCELISATIAAGCRARTPVLGLWSSAGAALQEGAGSLDGVSRVFAAIVAASGRVPQISLIHGPAAGGAAYGPALTDVVLMNQTARVFVTGPAVVRHVTGQDVTAEQLGGSQVHGRDSGVAHVTVNSDHDLAHAARDVVDLLDRPGSVDAAASASPVYDPASLLPESSRRAYHIHPVTNALLEEPGVELHQCWAPNVVTTG